MSKKMTALPSGAGPAVERPGLAEVSDGLGALPERLTEEAEVVVGVGEVRVAVDRLAIGLERLLRRGSLQLDREIGPLLRREGGGGGGGCCWRRRQGHLLGDGLHLEVEEELSRVRLPAGGSVPGNDPAAVGIDRQARQVLIIRELALEGGQHSADPLQGDTGAEEALGGFQEQEILESELEPPPGTPDRREETRADARPYLLLWQVEDLRRIPGGEVRHFLTAWAFFSGFPGVASARLAFTAGFFSCVTRFARLSLSASIRSIT